MKGRFVVAFQDALQAISILVLGGIVATIAHKGYADVAALAQTYSGAEFWSRLGRYLLANLAG